MDREGSEGGKNGERIGEEKNKVRKEKFRQEGDRKKHHALTPHFSRITFCFTLKGHSQLVHKRITYHSIANLHITETR